MTFLAVAIGIPAGFFVLGALMTARERRIADRRRPCSAPCEPDGSRMPARPGQDVSASKPRRGARKARPEERDR